MWTCGDCYLLIHQTFFDGIVYGNSKFVCTVTVTVTRQTDGYGDNFDALRSVHVENDSGLNITYNDFIGANAVDEEFAKKYDGMTLPDGKYFLSSDTYLLTQQSDGSFDSNSYANVLALKTNDNSIPKETRDKINDTSSGYFCHANQKKTSNTSYSTRPRSAGCNISDGQVKQDIFMSLVNLAPRPEYVEYTIQSISNMERN